MALFARAEYGFGKIRHRFFPDKPVDTFESVVLRNSGNDNQSTWLTYPRAPIDEFSRGKIDASVAELREEREAVSGLL